MNELKQAVSCGAAAATPQTGKKNQHQGHRRDRRGKGVWVGVNGNH